MTAWRDNAHRDSRPVSPPPTCRHKTSYGCHQQSHCTCQRVDRSVLAGRTMHHPRLPTVNPQVHRDSAPLPYTSNQFTFAAQWRSLLHNLRANRPSPRKVAPISRKQARERSPARSTKVRPPISTSRAVPGDTTNLKSSAHEPTSRPISLTVIRLS